MKKAFLFWLGKVLVVACDWVRMTVGIRAWRLVSNNAPNDAAFFEVFRAHLARFGMGVRQVTPTSNLALVTPPPADMKQLN